MRIIRYNSPVVLNFTIISFIILIIGSVFTDTTLSFFSVYMAPLSHPMFYIRLFTHVLGHADITHYTGNFLIILLLGPMVEEKYGSKRLLIMILIVALTTGIVHVILFNTVLLGASGITFMFMLLGSYANFKRGTIPLTLILVITIFLGREVTDMISGSNSNISQLSHIIGGGLGAIFGYFINRNKRR